MKIRKRRRRSAGQQTSDYDPIDTMLDLCCCGVGALVVVMMGMVPIAPDIDEQSPPLNNRTQLITFWAELSIPWGNSRKDGLPPYFTCDSVEQIEVFLGEQSIYKLYSTTVPLEKQDLIDTTVDGLKIGEILVRNVESYPNQLVVSLTLNLDERAISRFSTDGLFLFIRTGYQDPANAPSRPVNDITQEKKLTQFHLPGKGEASLKPDSLEGLPHHQGLPQKLELLTNPQRSSLVDPFPRVWARLSGTSGNSSSSGILVAGPAFSKPDGSNFGNSLVVLTDQYFEPNRGFTRDIPSEVNSRSSQETSNYYPPAYLAILTADSIDGEKVANAKLYRW